MANKIYTTFQISENISETPEGFLLCKDVPILRAGDLLYAPDETKITPGDGPTVLSRTVEEIHNPETIASFEGKPITLYHPDDQEGGSEFVTPENWKEFSVGTVQNVRPGEGEDEDKLLCDLLITDAEAIEAVKSKRIRQVSGAYSLKTYEIEPGHGEQRNLIGNHVALVPKGRCGEECAIFDHETVKETKEMSLKDKVMGIFGKAFDEAMPEDKKEEEVVADEVAPVEAVEEVLSDEPTFEAAVLERLSVIETALLKLIGGEAEQPEEMEQVTPAGTVGETQSDEAVVEEVVEEVVAEKCMDEDTLSRAEILSPGIDNTVDVAERALVSAYGTQDGKAVIDTLLSGRSFDSADKALLFIGASELMKEKRKQKLVSAGRSFDSADMPMSGGVITAEKMNEINATIYNKKK